MIFWVQCHHISRALIWLKENNPKYYGDIVIGAHELDQLPEDDVLDEILGVIQQSKDEGLVDQESLGYAWTEDIGICHLIYLHATKAELVIICDRGSEETVPQVGGDPHASSQDTGK